MSGRNVRILDTIAGIEIDYDTFPLRNLHALDYLPLGLYELALTVRERETQEITERGPGAPRPDLAFMPGPYGRRIANLFNWFSLSLCNYLRLIALIEIASRHQWDSRQIRKNHEQVKQHCIEYVKGVIPDVHLWRNKIAAHPALTAPQKKENLALLAYSVADTFALVEGRFFAGYMQLAVGGTVAPIRAWSVTDTFEQLAPRYWPEWRLPTLPE